MHLSDEEAALLASLQRLDSNILNRALSAAGLASPRAPLGQQGGARGRGRGQGGRGGGRGVEAGDLSNSLMQEQLRISLDRLDDCLLLLRQEQSEGKCGTVRCCPGGLGWVGGAGRA